LIKRTNLDIKDKDFLNGAYILQHSTSHATTKSTQAAMVNALRKNFSLLPAGKDSKSTH